MDIDIAPPADWAIAEIASAIGHDIATLMPAARDWAHRERQYRRLEQIQDQVADLLADRP